jgi:spoIIIJ-associated protein
MGERLFFSGRSLQQALLAAARHFRLDPEEIAYSERERQGGFIKNPRVVIEVDPASPRRSRVAAEPPRPAQPPERPAQRPPLGVPRPRAAATPPPERAPDPEAVAAAAREGATLLLRLAGLEASAEVHVDPAGSEISIQLVGADASRLAAGEGELLQVFEHVLPRLLRGMLGVSTPCRVDAAGFRAARDERLRRLALETAETARREGRPQSLPEMSPAERRIVHLTLEGEPSVTTESQGEGFLKSVRVIPV